MNEREKRSKYIRKTFIKKGCKEREKEKMENNLKKKGRLIMKQIKPTNEKKTKKRKFKS